MIHAVVWLQRWFIGTTVLVSTACLAPGVAQPSDDFPAGEYRFEDGAWFSLSRTGNTDDTVKPFFMDGKTQRMESLLADGVDRYRATGNGRPGDTTQTSIVVVRNPQGEVTHLEVAEAGESPRIARRVDAWTDRDISFDNGDVKLAGTLRLPQGNGPFPAIVLLHGSGPGTRLQLSPMSAFFARLGLATLIFDKRGCGGSAGDWRKVDLDALADDALAGVRWLQAQPQIDARRVGLYGISQGGWVGPLAASRDHGVAFVINHSGPGTSLREQDTHMTAAVLRAGGLSDADIESAIHGLNTVYDYGQQKSSAAQVQAVLDTFQAHASLKELLPAKVEEINPDKLYQSQPIGDPAWFFHLNPDRDALEPYRRIQCPLLVVYGQHDFTIPVAKSVSAIDGVLHEAGHTEFEIKVLADCGHGVLRMSAEQPMRPAEPYRFEADFFDLLADWLRRHHFAE